jgi:hypothetical protein
LFVHTLVFSPKMNDKVTPKLLPTLYHKGRGSTKPVSM